ncbi:KR-domain-containing protein [Dothidotthia symphoricarpi CBS 119687]|uniref:KR-domain-containing protein n=1 Tax=Dothidotthia symphoricarpi CBS 119687 TaxID=1392245 RepID=A0A6A6AFA2_9PLEO|nr:KR-domain-containing protein [Dothidotthia symphoricarpi CBS 119687]KAF2129624.1 KR-domain-containing protein [Dothidotthia symphoricarpi CBS 119687]
MACHSARNVVVIGRSGYDDPRSQAVLKDLAAEGCHVDLVRGDVAKVEDPVGGMVQDAMVLRDKPFETMTLKEYHGAIISKLEFFTMLSSISGLTGQPAQANYAAANVFLDNFAYYMRGLGLKGDIVDLGLIEDVGYMAEHFNLITALDTSAWTPINESICHKIVQFSIMQQEDTPINQSSYRKIQALLKTIKTGADVHVALTLAFDVANKQFMTTLCVDEPLEPARPLSAYGLDSLAVVEFRNWFRVQLEADLTTLQVTSAPSLLSLAEKIVVKIQAANVAK